jgi:hypothetical protein
MRGTHRDNSGRAGLNPRLNVFETPVYFHEQVAKFLIVEFL